MKILFSLIIFILFLIYSSYAQNLISCGANDFIEYKRVFNSQLKSTFLAQKNELNYFNFLKYFPDKIRSTNEILLDNASDINPFGKIDTSLKSKCKIGLVLNNKENLEVTLVDTLRKGVEYEISCYIQLSQVSSGIVKGIPIYFSNKSIAKYGFPTRTYFSDENVYDEFELLEMHSQDSSYLSSYSWVKVSCRFKAKGGERFLLIGHSFNNRKFQTIKNKKKTFRFLKNYVNKENVKRRYKDIYENVMSFYFVDSLVVKPINLEVSYNNKHDVWSVGILGGQTSYDKDKVSKEYEVGKLYFINNVSYSKDGLFIMPYSLKGLINIQMNVFYTFQYSKIKLIYFVEEKEYMQNGTQLLENTRQYIINEMKVNQYRILTEVRVSDTITKGLYFELLNF
jgi:hypothetical protein